MVAVAGYTAHNFKRKQEWMLFLFHVMLFPELHTRAGPQERALFFYTVIWQKEKNLQCDFISPGAVKSLVLPDCTDAKHAGMEGVGERQRQGLDG